ncbi:MAG: histidine phosphatase family protein [Anaerolineales bacterium]|nr:histidine phosphatase family protein [Anaerolineales bacterium]
MATLYLVRHGETPWNVEGRYQGQLDRFAQNSLLGLSRQRPLVAFAGQWGLGSIRYKPIR